jgi:hypothetical protein
MVKSERQRYVAPAPALNLLYNKQMFKMSQILIVAYFSHLRYIGNNFNPNKRYKKIVLNNWFILGDKAGAGAA